MRPIPFQVAARQTDLAAQKPDRYRHSEPEDHDIRALSRRVDRTIARARWAILWEGLWPVVARAAMVACMFLGLSWLGVWTMVADWVRIPALVLLAAALVYALLPLRHLRWPSSIEAERRIEQASGYRHRPLETLTDDLAVGDRNAASQALWAVHKARVAASIRRLAAGFPTPKFYRHDPYALRVVVAVLFIAGFFAAGGRHADLLKTAFVSTDKTPLVAGRIDAWIAPPRYTNRAPVFLTGDNRPGTADGAADGKEAGGKETATLKVPVNSELIVRVQGFDTARITLGEGKDRTEIGTATENPEDGAPKGGAPKAGTEVTKVATTEGGATARSSPSEVRHKLIKGGLLTIAAGPSGQSSWRIEIEPDQPPAINLVRTPEPDISGTMKYTYAMTDDYGIASATASMVLDGARAKPRANARPLFEAPGFPLILPSGRGRTGEAFTRHDLSAHPWAGSAVKITLTAVDVAGQQAKSPTKSFTLPMRQFGNPVARAIIEQRRNLALDANARDEVIEAMSAMMIAPDKFLKNPGHFLAIRHTFHSLLRSETDDELRGVVAELWNLALFLEDGDVSLAAQKLRNAEEALRDALERGASDEEIKKLMKELREALNQYMQALAEQARRNPNARMQPIDPNMRMLRSEDLQKMLDRLEDLARSGSRDAARQLLSQLQQMMENLRTGRMQPQQRGNNPMMKMLDELGDIIRRQQKLMDETHRLDQQNRNDEGMSPSERARRDRMMRSLRRGQGDLKQSLDDLMKSLRRFGMQPGNRFGQAGKEMEGAEGALGKGRTGRAIGRQGEALRALRQGAEGMMRQMMGMMRGPGQGNQFMGSPSARRTDPLGRPNRTPGTEFGDHVKVPDEIDAQRARRILEELRRRLADPKRRALERDYLERLLKRY